MLDNAEIAGILGSAIACLGSAAAVIFTGGKQIGRVEAAIGRLVGIEAKLAKVDEHNGLIWTIGEVVRNMRSDHRELRGRVDNIDSKLDKVAELTAEMRGKLTSIHDD
jgi:hypothetical protein